MFYTGSRNKDKGVSLSRLANVAGDVVKQPRHRECPQHYPTFPTEIISACMRLGIPLSLFVGLVANGTIEWKIFPRHEHHPFPKLSDQHHHISVWC